MPISGDWLRANPRGVTVTVLTRTRRDWERVFSTWSKPPGKTEQERCDRALRAIKDAVAADATLATKSVRTFPQGSYRNRTNVWQDSDVDVCVLCEDTFYYGLPAGISAQDAGIFPATYKFGSYKNDVERALVNRFGRSNVRRGNKVTLTPKSGPGGSSPMRPERWSYPSWPVPASGSRCSSGAVVGYRRSRCTRIAQPWPRAG